MELSLIRKHIKEGSYKFSDHAVKRMMKRCIRRQEIEAVLLAGEIIEESPSCLVCGITQEGRVLHVLVSMPPQVVVVTAYEPDPDEWIEARTRRRQ